MSVSLVNIGIIVGLLAIGLAITLVVVRILRRRRDIALRRHGAPVLVMPVAGPEVSAAPRPAIARDEWPQDRVSPRAVRRITPRSPTSVRNITPFIPEPVASEPDVLIVPDEDHVTTSTGPFRPSEARSGSDRKSTRLNSSHSQISYAVFC